MDESKLELWEKPYLKFKDLPISTKTLQGLNSSKYFNYLLVPNILLW